MTWDLSSWTSQQLGKLLIDIKKQPLSDAEHEEATAELIGQINDELDQRWAADEDSSYQREIKE